MLTDLLPFVDEDAPVPASLMLDLLNEAQGFGGTEERREIANKVLAGAGDYLPSRGYLSAFISAKITIEEASAIIAERKVYVERLRILLPSILRLLGEREQGRLRSLLMRIDDCCHDFPIVRKAPHAKRTRKKILTDVHGLREAATALEAALRSAGSYVDIEYRDHRTAMTRHLQNPSVVRDTKSLAADIRHLRVAAEMVLYRDETGGDAFYVGDNKASTHIVQAAYELTLWCGRPKFVTTPGADFSLLCGLLFELAGGQQDASLAGAINRFSRSDLRNKLDRDEAESRWENSDEYVEARDADNFCDVAENIEQLKQEHAFWTKAAGDSRWDEDTRKQLKMRATDVLEQIQDANLRNGPYLMWGSQIVASELARMRREDEESDAALLALEIEAGKRQRAVDLISHSTEKRGQHD